MNRVLLTGRLTRDPELRTTASGKSVATFSLATHQYVGGKELSEFHSVVAWDRLADTCGKYLGKGQQVAVEGRIATRTWDDDKGSPPLEDRDRRRPASRCCPAPGARTTRRRPPRRPSRRRPRPPGYTPDASEPVADDVRLHASRPARTATRRTRRTSSSRRPSRPDPRTLPAAAVRSPSRAAARDAAARATRSGAGARRTRSR